MLHFHRFDRNILDFKYIFDEFQTFILDNNVYALGDFNAVLDKSILQQLFDKLNSYEFLFDEVTTIDNKKCDNIILPHTAKILNKQIIPNNAISDHYLCIAELDFKE